MKEALPTPWPDAPPRSSRRYSGEGNEMSPQLADVSLPGPSAFGSRVRELRTARGWSQRTLAAAAGLHPDSVADLERGRHAARPETANALAAALARPAALLPGAVGRRMPGRVASSATAGAFGALLARYRRRAGLSQNALAKVANTNASYIVRLESGEREQPSRAVALALARATGLTDPECDRLLVAAGHAPSYCEDRTVRQVAALLAGDAVLATALRAQVAALFRLTRDATDQVMGGEG